MKNERITILDTRKKRGNLLKWNVRNNIELYVKEVEIFREKQSKDHAWQCIEATLVALCVMRFEFLLHLQSMFCVLRLM